MIGTEKFLECIILTHIFKIIINFSFNRLRWDQRKGNRVKNSISTRIGSFGLSVNLPKNTSLESTKVITFSL